MTRVAIILGAAVRADGSASPALRRRALFGAQLFHQGDVDMIIASGGVPKAGQCEADVIAQICRDTGVAESAIFTERKSCNTLENIIYSMSLLPKNAKVTIVTDRYHRLRAGLIARECALKADLRSPPVDQSRLRPLLRGYLREGAALMLYGLRRAKRIILRPSP